MFYLCWDVYEALTISETCLKCYEVSKELYSTLSRLFLSELPYHVGKEEVNVEGMFGFKTGWDLLWAYYHRVLLCFRFFSLEGGD